MAPTAAWTGASGFSRLRYRANGVTENVAKAHAGTATEAANTRADNGSAITASTAIEIAAAIAPPSSPQPRVAIMIGNGARYASAIVSMLDCALTTNKQRGGASGSDGDDKAMQHDERCPRWLAVRRGVGRPPPTAAAAERGGFEIQARRRPTVVSGSRKARGPENGRA